MRLYLSDKAKPILWTSEQLRELAYGLRTYVERDQARRLWFRHRADWFGSYEYYLNLESLLFEPALDRFSTKYSEELTQYFDTTLIMIKLSKSKT
jgi:hypothetical protein